MKIGEKVFTDNELIVRLYVCDKLSTTDISKIVGVSRSTIRLRLIERGVDLRNPSEAIKMYPEKLGHKGIKRTFTDEWKNNMSIAMKKHWSNRALGFRLKQSGYYEVTVGENKSRPLHDVIMEQHIGRKLTSDEVVHHIDKIKTNNSIENLMLLSRAKHSSIHGKENYNNGTCYDISKHSGVGENHRGSKLKESQVIEIFNSDESYDIISKRYNISNSCINHIKSRRNWKHLKL